jgi:hypothetical protein
MNVAHDEAWIGSLRSRKAAEPKLRNGRTEEYGTRFLFVGAIQVQDGN